MEVKPGYKQTEVGEIPEDWDIVTLGEVVSYVASGKSKVKSSNGKYPVYGSTGVIGYCDMSDYTGDAILVARVGANAGTINFVSDEYCVTDNTIIVRFSVNHSLPFFAYQLVSKRLNTLVFGSGQPLITGTQLKGLAVYAPLLSEQRAIATALGDVDALITALDQLIAKRRDIKQAAMQELLTGKRRLPGFSGEWEVKRLDQIADVDCDNLGSNTNPDYIFTYISLDDVDHGSLRGFSDQVFKTAPSRARQKIRKGDILVSTVRPNLKSHLLFMYESSDWICSTGFSVVRSKYDKAAPGYIFFHLFGGRVAKQIEAMLVGSNYPAISSRDVRTLQIPIPPLDEQIAIATVLSDMDAEIVALEGKRDKTKTLKQGMMQELLTGRIRLV